MKIRQHFGRQVSRLRAARGMTQADLAAKLSEKLDEPVATLTVTRIETAKRPTTVEELAALSAIFGVDPASLIAAGPIEMAMKNVRWQGTQAQRRVERLQAQGDLELKTMEALAALVPPLVTLDRYMRTGLTTGVPEAIALLIDAETVPEFAEATTLQDLATELRSTLSESEAHQFAEAMKGTAMPTDEALAVISRLIEERGAET